MAYSPGMRIHAPHWYGDDGMPVADTRPEPPPPLRRARPGAAASGPDALAGPSLGTAAAGAGGGVAAGVEAAAGAGDVAGGGEPPATEDVDMACVPDWLVD